MVKYYGTGQNTVQTYLNMNHQGITKANVDTFLKTKALIRNHIILDQNCICEPLVKDPAQCPK